MLSAVRLVAVMILQVVGLCLAITGHLGEQGLVLVLGIVLVGLTSVGLVGVLLRESLRRG